MIRIERSREVDLTQLGQLFRDVGWTRRTDPPFLRELVDGSWRVVWAAEGPLLVGFARAISDGCSNAYVSTVAVRPDRQRQGIGRRLMAALLEGGDALKWVLHASEAGEGLYRSLGFEDAPRMLVLPRRAT